MSELVEAAFSGGGSQEQWSGRVTWKCPVCGRRNAKIVRGSGHAFPLRVVCKNRHEVLVVPYAHPMNIFESLIDQAALAELKAQGVDAQPDAEAHESKPKSFAVKSRNGMVDVRGAN